MSLETSPTHRTVAVVLMGSLGILEPLRPADLKSKPLVSE